MDFTGLSKMELVDACEERSLPTTGNKKASLGRLNKYQHNQQRINTNDGASGSQELFTNPDQNDTMIQHISPERCSDITNELELIKRERNLVKRERELLEREKQLKNCKRMPQGDSHIRLSPKDVMDILPEFDPSKSNILNAEQFKLKIESLQQLYEIDERLILLVIGTKLKGAANIWFKSIENHWLTWREFSCQLLDSFRPKTNDADIHESLRLKSQKRDQNLIEYFYEMCAIGRTKVSDEALIKYIIQ